MATMPVGVAAAIEAAARDEVKVRARAVDRERRFPQESIRALAAAGGLGLMVPEAHGGDGGSLAALAGACMAVGEACASTGMVFLMHSVTAATVAAGGGARAGDVLADMAAGSLGTLAFSERGTGAHFYAPELRVARDGQGVARISGRKSFVTSGGHARHHLVLVAGAEEGGADAYLIERDRPGVRFDGAWDGLGMHGNSSVAMELTDVVVSEDDRVGEPGGALGLVFTAVAPAFLVGLAAVNAGIAAAALAAATEHVRGRRYAGGGGLAEVPHVQHLLARIELEARTARLATFEAARLGDAGDESALVAIMQAKVAATEAAQRATDLALEATGGQGYTPALDVERHLRDARAGAVMAPTNAVLRTWIGKALAGLPVP
jgi:isovaleryl-CoA dehydrogenase